MAGRRRVLHVIRDAQKTICANYWYPGDRVCLESEVETIKREFKPQDWCKTCVKHLMARRPATITKPTVQDKQDG